MMADDKPEELDPEKETLPNKPEDLTPDQAYIRFDSEKNRIYLNVGAQMGAPLTVRGSQDKKYVILVLDAEQEVMSYGILEKARQEVQNISDAKKIMEFKKQKAAFDARQKIMGGTASA